MILALNHQQRLSGNNNKLINLKAALICNFKVCILYKKLVL